MEQGLGFLCGTRGTGEGSTEEVVVPAEEKNVTFNWERKGLIPVELCNIFHM